MVSFYPIDLLYDRDLIEKARAMPPMSEKNKYIYSIDALYNQEQKDNFLAGKAVKMYWAMQLPGSIGRERKKNYVRDKYMVDRVPLRIKINNKILYRKPIIEGYVTECTGESWCFCCADDFNADKYFYEKNKLQTD